MQKKITPASLNKMALRASVKKYHGILTQLEYSAKKGRNGILVNDIPEVLVAKLRRDGYRVIPFFKVKKNLLFGKKKKKYYAIKFKL